MMHVIILKMRMLFRTIEITFRLDRNAYDIGFLAYVRNDLISTSVTFFQILRWHRMH